MAVVPGNPLRALVHIGAAVLAILVIAVLRWASVVLIPIALAILLTFILVPLVAWLQGRQLNRTVAVLLTAVLAFLVVGGMATGLILELQSLSADLPRYQENITKKIARLQEVGQGTVLERLHQAAQAIGGRLAPSAPGQPSGPVAVRVESTGWSQLQTIANSGSELLATAGLVVVLVVFMLIQREDLRDRMIRLLGQASLPHTTRALDDAAQRISRFLFMQVMVNAGFGLVLSIGLYTIGVPYAFLWGFLTGALRFIPYVGSSVGALVLLTFCVAAFPGWTPLLLVILLFGGLELGAAYALEPLLFGHSTGVSPLALLIAAAFWTWVWGPVGLLLSTPLTVCLVVLGKHAPPLEFFDVLLGDEPALTTEITFYQRLLARDADEATTIVLAYVRSSPREKVYDDLLIAALSSAKRDRELDRLSGADEAFIIQACAEIVEDLGEGLLAAPAAGPEQLPPAPADAAPLPVRLLGLPARDAADELGLTMLQQLLDPARWEMEVAGVGALAAELIATVAARRLAVLCIGSLPPGGLAPTRYLCKRLRARFPTLKIVVGRWGLHGDVRQDREALQGAGADRVETTLLATRDYLTSLLPTLEPLARRAS